MVTCELCGDEFKTITHKHLRYKHGYSVKQYLEEFNLTSLDLYSHETRKAISKGNKGKKIGNGNPARRTDVRNKIAEGVRKQWQDGAYHDRINGMLGKYGELSPQYKSEKHTPLYLAEHEYVDFLKTIHAVDFCFRCNSTENKINIHHIDEDHTNFLPSNLEPLCVNCHMTYHYTWAKGPFIIIGRRFSFAAAHYLPLHDGLCQNLHGHEWEVDIKLRKRIDYDSEMVMDFSDLKYVVNDCVINKLDHSLLNDHIENPTAENICVYIWQKLMLEGYLKGIHEITVWESKNSSAMLNVEGMLSMYKTTLEGGHCET